MPNKLIRKLTQHNRQNSWTSGRKLALVGDDSISAAHFSNVAFHIISITHKPLLWFYPFNHVGPLYWKEYDVNFACRHNCQRSEVLKVVTLEFLCVRKIKFPVINIYFPLAASYASGSVMLYSETISNRKSYCKCNRSLQQLQQMMHSLMELHFFLTNRCHLLPLHEWIGFWQTHMMSYRGFKQRWKKY